MGFKEIVKPKFKAGESKTSDEAEKNAEYVTFIVCNTCSNSYPVDFFMKCPYCQTINPQKK